MSVETDLRNVGGGPSVDGSNEPAGGRRTPGKRPTGMWAEDARANVAYLRGRTNALRGRDTDGRAVATSAPEETARGLTQARNPAERDAVCDAVDRHLAMALAACTGQEPPYRRLRDWWTGSCVEATYKNLHYAEATLARLYDPADVRFAVPDALRRAKDALADDDPTRRAAMRMLTTVEDRKVECPCSATELSEIIAVGHEAADKSRARLHTFRNVLLVSTVVSALALGLFVLLTWFTPEWVPMCFKEKPSDLDYIACPTGAGPRPSGGDVLIVALLGLLGGGLSSAVFVRGLYVSSTPYNVAVPLALLKLPAGALVAIAGVLLLAGNFVPGFSVIDQQSQILSYAFVLGFAQQMFTKMIDSRAEKLIANVPSKARRDDLGRDGARGGATS